MLSIILDPGLFAIPPYESTEDDVHLIVRRLTHWSSVLEGGEPVLVFKLSGTEAALAVSNCLPPEPNLKALFELYGLHEVFAINDVIRVYHGLLSRARVLGDSQVEVAECEVELVPNPLQNYAPPILVEQSKLALANAILREVYQPNFRMYPVVSWPNCECVDFDACGAGTAVTGPGSEYVAIPTKFDRKVSTLGQLDDLAGQSHSEGVWNSCERIEEFYLAIALGCAAIQAARGAPAGLRNVPQFWIGPEFVESLNAVQGGPNQSYSSVVFNACCRAILGLDKLSAMGKPQTVRMEDGATAWRMHITKAHQALRLMLWLRKGRVELANVANKWNLVIAKGYKGAATLTL
jgi:hypothetical protein